jgi:hypothetical protein
VLMTLTEPVKNWICTKPVRNTAEFWLGGIKDTDEFLLSYSTRFLVSGDSDTAEFSLTTKPIWFRSYQIRNLWDTEPVRSLTYQILNLSDSEPTRYRTCQIPNLSDTEPINIEPKRYQTCQILNLSYTQPIKYQISQIPNLSDTKFLSDTEQCPTPHLHPEMTATPPSTFRETAGERSIQSPPPPTSWWSPLSPQLPLYDIWDSLENPKDLIPQWSGLYT